ncbi:hypothetical protein NDU88_002643 [Pleurodeles waltl]|uniref:Uncharacterized protein n=1 Tax=Pleurodeles waltl TaxID=8319 RepID=A0AAV7Q9Z4_PLEWA|nr:hypothetical protein NDU88_002643 [Pleurodeles waltl]
MADKQGRQKLSADVHTRRKCGPRLKESKEEMICVEEDWGRGGTYFWAAVTAANVFIIMVEAVGQITERPTRTATGQQQVTKKFDPLDWTVQAEECARRKIQTLEPNTNFSR